MAKGSSGSEFQVFPIPGFSALAFCLNGKKCVLSSFFLFCICKAPSHKTKFDSCPTLEYLTSKDYHTDAGYFPSKCYRFCQVVWQDEEHADHQEQNDRLLHSESNEVLHLQGPQQKSLHLKNRPINQSMNELDRNPS